MMKVRFILILVVILSLAEGIVQAQTSLDLFNQFGNPIAFTPDSRFLASVRLEVPANPSVETPTTQFIDVYRVSPFERVDSYAQGAIDPNGSDTIGTIAISHDAQRIAFVRLGGLYVLDRSTGETTPATANFFEFEGLEFNPVNNLLAYLVGRGVTIFDTTNPTVQYELFDDVYGERVNNISWSLDGRYLASGVFRGGENGHDVIVWDMTDIESPIDRDPSFALLGGEPSAIAWRDENTLASFGNGGVSIFDIPSRSLIVFIPNPENLYWTNGVWSPDGTQLLASGGNSVTETTTAQQLWDVSNLPAYVPLEYQEGNVPILLVGWNQNGLFQWSSEGLVLNDTLFSAQLTATAQFTPQPSPTATPTPLPPPALTALCTLDPATTRNWRITNPNATEMAVTWQLFNSPMQMGTVTIPANSTYDFSTAVEAGNETMRLIVGGQVVAEATGYRYFVIR